MRRVSNYHDPLEFVATIPNALVSSLDGLVFGNKRRNFSSICIFVYGAGLAFCGGFAAKYPAESLAMMADAWDVQLDATHAAAAFSRHILAIGGIHLSAWGIGCMCLAPSSAAPQIKRLAAILNLIAAILAAACSAYHPEAVAAPRCAASAAAAAKCVKTAGMWYLPVAVVAGLGVWFADAGPRLVRLDATRAILLDGVVDKARRGAARITRVDDRADLVEYASPRVLDQHAQLVPQASPARASDYAGFVDEEPSTPKKQQ
jgi:hypothetical protein